MDYEEYKTQKGDTWDMLSLLAYDSEYYLQELLKANPEYRKVFIFDEGIVLKIPLIEIDEAEDVPEWMEEDDLSLEDDGLDDGEVDENGIDGRESW